MRRQRPRNRKSLTQCRPSDLWQHEPWSRAGWPILPGQLRTCPALGGCGRGQLSAHLFSLSLGSALCGHLPSCLCETRLVVWAISHAEFTQPLGEQRPQCGCVLVPGTELGVPQAQGVGASFPFSRMRECRLRDVASLPGVAQPASAGLGLGLSHAPPLRAAAQLSRVGWRGWPLDLRGRVAVISWLQSPHLSEEAGSHHSVSVRGPSGW